MKGHIHSRTKGSHRIVVDLGRKPDGNRNQQTKTIKGTKKQAQEVLAEMLSSYNKGTYIEPSKETVSQYLDSWLDTIAHSVRGTTLERYKSICDFYIKPLIGSVNISQLKARQINKMYTTLLTEGRPDGGKLSARTVLHAHRVLHTAFTNAVKEGVLLVNPCTGATAPSVEKTERLTFTAEETLEVLDKASGTRLFLPILIAVTMGLRRGEFLGLRWTDIDFDKKELTVRQSASEIDKKVIYGEPKTKKSMRRLAIPTIALDALKAYRAEQAKICLQLGNSINNDKPIMSGLGGFSKPNQLTVSYAAFIKQHKFKRVTYHDLRHTYATLLLEQNIHPKIMSELLGHSTIALTMDTYSHVMPGMQQEAANKVDQIFKQ